MATMMDRGAVTAVGKGRPGDARLCRLPATLEAQDFATGERLAASLHPALSHSSSGSAPPCGSWLRGVSTYQRCPALGMVP
jgi:hypothetical protein